MSIIILNVSIRLPSSHSQSLKMSFLLLATATTESKHKMNYDVFLSLKIVFNLANGADLDCLFDLILYVPSTIRVFLG